jgi:hypothetical protein
MRRSAFVDDGQRQESSSLISWLDLEKLATVELSSEDPRHPFEHALEEQGEGWRALSPGPQVIRIRFANPQTVTRMHLHFHEADRERSQEIALFVTTKTASRKELVRQQWEFSPDGANNEIEDYTFHLQDVTMLELEIDPGRHDSQALATLKHIQIG